MCNTESIFLCVSTSEAEPPLLHITTLTTEWGYAYPSYPPPKITPMVGYLTFASVACESEVEGKAVVAASASDTRPTVAVAGGNVARAVH